MVALSSESDDAASAPVLVVTGRLAKSGVLAVDPVYEMRSDMATDDGNDRVYGVDKLGKRLFVAHFNASGSGRFTAYVPVTQAQVERLAMLRVEIGNATALVNGTGATDPQANVYRERRGTVAVSWDARAFPELAISGRVKGAVVAL